MDKISSELLDRIRTAVIKKLREMKRYVDNELPDYIMILVANKRTIDHMKKDLTLFLGEHTADFSSWLFDMIAHLKKSCPNENSSSKFDASVEKNNSEEDADVLDYDLGEQEGDLMYQDDNSMSNKQSVSGKISKSNVRESIMKPMRSEDAISDQNRQLVTQKSAKVYPVQPVSRPPSKPNFSVMAQHSAIQSSIFLDEYDPTKPEFSSSISSVVHSMQKNYSKLPALQTNKLLLRAVKDATKSVMENRNMNKYKPTPIKMLASTQHDNCFGSRSRNLVNVRIDPTLNLVANPSENFSVAPTVDENEPEAELNVFEGDNYEFVGAENNNRTICLASEQSAMSFNAIPLNSAPVHMEQEEEETGPHFIVTLDGVDLPSFKRKFSDSEESMDAEDEFTVDEDFDSNQKGEKSAERCKYWPSCKHSDGCIYHHPSIPCKSFPDCRYGDKCLYVHPNCRFDARCSRKDCPYTHAIKKKFHLPLVAHKRPVNVGGFKAVCKFYPKCTVKNCAFIHPKLCRFGTKCRMPTCRFTHVSIPPRKQMKWMANVSEDGSSIV